MCFLPTEARKYFPLPIAFLKVQQIEESLWVV